MIISFKNKFIFLSNPKCGSSTLRLVLDPYININTQSVMGADDEEFARQGTLVLHMSSHELKEVVDQSENIGKYLIK